MEESSAMPQDDERVRIMGDLLHGAIPISPSGGSYVTKEEFMVTVKMIESKIENAALKQKQWVLTGVIATLLAFGGGYMSIVSKLDQLNNAIPEIVQRQNDRSAWIQRQEQRDTIQDGEIKKLDNTYEMLPYQPPPQ